MGHRPFVHLHVHTQFSLLDGAIRLGDLLSRAEEYGMPAVAMTDHGNMFGALEFYTKAKGKSVRPILGCEVYLSAGPRGEKSQRADTHLVLLAKDREGYRNLAYLVSTGYLDGMHHHPRIDREVLGERSKGLIGLSGCMGGAVVQPLLHQGPDEAQVAACELRDLFEKDSFYLEIQDHGFPEQAQVNRILADVGERAGLPLVATNDCHFLGVDDAAAYQVLTCIASGKVLAPDAPPVSGAWTQMYLKSGDEMAAALREYPAALENTLAIAERCKVDFDLGKTYLPQYEVPEGHVLETFLTETAREGLERRFVEAADAGRACDRGAYEARLAMELDVINRMGFAGYFLIVWDFIRYARDKGVPVGPGRGSGAGSLVAYALKITNIDPIPYNLLFERFLNPERVSMPDFDIDFCMYRRDEVIQYVTQKYGALQVGQIATFHELKSRSCVRDVGRALGFAYTDVDKIAKLIPEPVQGRTTSVPEALEKEPRLKEIYKSDARIATLLDHAIKLEGLNRHAGMHAAGVVIADKPLWEYVPVFRGQNGELVSQFDKDLVEKVGLVKFDFLGLKTLTVMDIAVTLIHKRPDATEFDLEKLPLDDADTFKLLQSGETTGVFQLESSGMQELFRKLRPDRFEDIVAAVALYRPGPLGTGMVDDYVQRKHGRTEVKYPHASLEEILRDTYGVIVYQEQVMQITSAMAGFSLGQADLLRRAMGKKKPEEMAKQKSTFVEGAQAKGIDAAKATEVFELLEFFAGYGFNKCVVGDTTLVDAGSGERTTVRELFERRRPFKVHALGEDGRLRARRVLDVMSNGRRRVFELVTAQGRRIRATANHPFRTLDGWTLLSDLAVGDRIAAPRGLPVREGSHWPAHEVITLAGLLSEGNTCHPSCLYFYGNEPTLVEDFARAAGCFPSTVARVSQRPDGRRLEVCLSTGADARFQPGQRPWNASEEEGIVHGNLAVAPRPRRSGAFEWARTLGLLGLKATDKRVPSGVFALRDEDLELFLGRLWAGDGFIANRSNFTPYYATSSEALAGDVQLLLSRLDITSGVHRKMLAAAVHPSGCKYRGGERVGYTVHLVGEGAVETFLARVAVHCVGREPQVELLRSRVRSPERGRTSKDTVPAGVRHWVDEERRARGLTWRELEGQSGVSTKELLGKGSAAKRGFRRATIARLAEFFDSQRLRDVATSDVFWDRIVSIEPAGVEETFDLTVDIDHNFVADGLIVHNSHSAAYALISYHTAYLKAHYPVEFMCALLTADKDKTEKVVRSIAEGRSMGITILPPDVNTSDVDFTVVYPPDGGKGAIRFGLGAVKGVGGAALESMFEARREGGPFRDLFDFATRVDVRKMNKGVVEALVWSGAFDAGLKEMGVSRAQAHSCIDAALERGRTRAKERESGQTNLFGLLDAGAIAAGTAQPEYPAVAGWDSKTLLAYERQALGFYITGHPLDRYRAELGRLSNSTTADLSEREEGTQVVVGGMVEAYRERIAKSGGRLAFFDLEDSLGRVEVIVRTRTFLEVETILKCGEPLLVTGSVQVDREREEPEAKILLESVQPLAQAARARARTVHIHLDALRVSDRELRSLKTLLEQNPGRCPVSLHLKVAAASDTILMLGDELAVEPGEALLASLERLFGATVAELR